MPHCWVHLPNAVFVAAQKIRCFQWQCPTWGVGRQQAIRDLEKTWESWTVFGKWCDPFSLIFSFMAIYLSIYSNTVSIDRSIYLYLSLSISIYNGSYQGVIFHNIYCVYIYIYNYILYIYTHICLLARRVNVKLRGSTLSKLTWSPKGATCSQKVFPSCSDSHQVSVIHHLNWKKRAPHGRNVMWLTEVHYNQDSLWAISIWI